MHHTGEQHVTPKKNGVYASPCFENTQSVALCFSSHSSYGLEDNMSLCKARSHYSHLKNISEHIWSRLSNSTSTNTRRLLLAWHFILPSLGFKHLLFMTVTESLLRSKGTCHLEKESLGLKSPYSPLLGR